MSTTFLVQASEALHAAGDPAHLYKQWRGALPPKPMGREFMGGWAREERFRQSCNCVLFAAFAAEAFVNEFLAAFDLAPERFAVIERWSTLRKYIEGTAEAYGERQMWEGAEAEPALRELFLLRNRLAHPKPGFGSGALLEDEDPQLAELFALPKLAEYVVMAAGAADALIWRAYGYGHFDLVATKLWRGRSVVRDFATRRAELPNPEDDPEPSLMGAISDYLATLAPLPEDPDASWTEMRRRGRPGDRGLL